jgi:hypothetical protein
LAGLGLAAAGCGGDPQSPPANPPSYQGQFAAGEMRLEDPTGLTTLRLVVTRVELDVATHRVHAWVAMRNAGSESVIGPAGVEVRDFTPGDVVPVNAGCIVCITTPCDVVCTFDHHGTYGDDDQLAPGEISAPVEWIFDNPSNASFAFRATIAVDPQPGDGRIGGTVFRDANANGHREAGEPALQGAIVTLYSDNGAQHEPSGADGRYAFRITAPGLYELVWGCPECGAPEYPCRLTTPAQRQVLIVQRPDGSLSSFLAGDFGCAGAFRLPIQGVVFEDLDRDGVRDRGEPGVADVRIVSASLTCRVVPEETRTDALGQYAIGLPGCAPWQVGHDPVDGFVDTTPNPVRIFQPRDPPRPGDPGFRIDFGVARN